MSKDAQNVESLSLGLKLGIAGALTIGAIASGYVVTRSGRRVLREALQGRRRSRLEDRVLDRVWNDRELGRRELDVEEVESGVIALSGRVRSDEERRRALALVRATKEVTAIQDRLQIIEVAELPSATRGHPRLRVLRGSA